VFRETLAQRQSIGSRRLRRFESGTSPLDSSVGLEHRFHKPSVAGSIPAPEHGLSRHDTGRKSHNRKRPGRRLAKRCVCAHRATECRSGGVAEPSSSKCAVRLCKSVSQCIAMRMGKPDSARTARSLRGIGVRGVSIFFPLPSFPRRREPSDFRASVFYELARTISESRWVPAFAGMTAERSDARNDPSRLHSNNGSDHQCQPRRNVP
jgi:hypothetical protein